MLFAVFLISLLAAVGLGIYCYGALVGVRRQKLDNFQVPPAQPQPYVQFVSLPQLPEPPVRAARGTTPLPLAPGAPLPPGVISNREDSTDPEVPADSRFSVTRSSQRRL
ncbi:MAG: hypothetical protein H0V17_10860 [Deltaproteobacteria bacterium]|nr:hypothetical protein [Deltaproteobacteria bacterium]